MLHRHGKKKISLPALVGCVVGNLIMEKTVKKEMLVSRDENAEIEMRGNKFFSSVDAKENPREALNNTAKKEKIWVMFRAGRTISMERTRLSRRLKKKNEDK